jgi:hypothetical protein
VILVWISVIIKMTYLSIDFDSLVIDSDSFCENDSESAGDGVKFSYVDKDCNGHCNIIWPFRHVCYKTRVLITDTTN